MIQDDMKRRSLGYGRGARMKFEQDELTLSGGTRLAGTMGTSDRRPARESGGRARRRSCMILG